MAAVPDDVVRIQASLNIGGGLENSQFGFHLQRQHETGNTVDWDADITRICDSVRDKIEAHVSSFPFAQASLDHVSAYHLNAATGKTAHEGHSAATGPANWSGSAALPLEVSWPLHLLAYPAGGFDPLRKNKRGRMSLGPISQSVCASNGLVSSSQKDNFTTGMAAFLNDINGLEIDNGPSLPGGNDNMRLVVLSRQRQAAYRVVAIQFGRKFGHVMSRQEEPSMDYTSAVINQS